MEIFEIGYIFDRLFLILSILLLLTAVLSLKRKTYKNLKNRNALLSGLFASTGDILGFFASGQIQVSIVAMFSGVSTYFLICFLDVSKNLLNRGTDLDQYLAYESAYILSFSHLLIYLLVRFMNTGEVSDVAILFAILLIICLGVLFMISRMKREKSWVSMTLEEKRKYYIIQEFFAIFSFSLGLWASYFLDKLILLLATVQVLKMFSIPIPSRRQFAYGLIKLDVLWERFRERRQTIKANVWYTLTNIRNFSPGYVYGWILGISSINIALNLQFVDSRYASQIIVTLISFLPAVFAYISIRNRLQERFVLSFIFFLWITVLIFICYIPHSLPLQNSVDHALSTTYPE